LISDSSPFALKAWTASSTVGLVDAQVRGDAGGALATRTGQEDLAAAQDEGIGGAQALLQGLALVVGQRSHKDRWSHAHQRTTFSFTYPEQALAMVGQVRTSVRETRAATR